MSLIFVTLQVSTSNFRINLLLGYGQSVFFVPGGLRSFLRSLAHLHDPTLSDRRQGSSHYSDEGVFVQGSQVKVGSVI